MALVTENIKNAEKNYFGKTVAFSFSCLFCCTLITDRIRNSSPVNSDGSKPVWNFFRSRVNLRIRWFFFPIRTLMALRCFRNRCLKWPRQLYDATPTRDGEQPTKIKERGTRNGKVRGGKENEERRTRNGVRGTESEAGVRGTENVERSTGSGVRGTENGERGTVNEERWTRNGKRGTENRERRTENGERGTENRERRTGKEERGTGNRETGVWDRNFNGFSLNFCFKFIVF